MNIIVMGTRGIPEILGGVETHCQELLPRIKKISDDINITVISRSAYVNNINSTNYYQGVSIKKIYSPKSKSLEAITHSVLSVFYAALKRPDILHIHAIGPSLVTPLARLLGLKVVVTHHGPDYERKKWGKIAKLFLKIGEWCGVKFANNIIVISKGIANQIEAKYKRKNYFIIPNGVPFVNKLDTIDYLTELGLEKQKFIFTLGRFVPEKGFDYLINSYVKSNLSPEIKLVIAGDADHETDYSLNLKMKAKNSGVVLAGFIKGSKLQELFCNCKLFVLPSFYEGLPISLLEAMSYNCNIIASNIEPNLEVNLPSDCYFELADENILKDLMLLKVNSVNQQIYNMDKYDWDNIALQTYDVYLKTYNHE